MPKPLLEVRNLCKSFGGVTATDHLDLSLQPGFIHAVIGPNGAGKTTTFYIIVGLAKTDSSLTPVGSIPLPVTVLSDIVISSYLYLS